MNRMIKKLLGTCALLVIALPAFSCDEACQKDKASAKHNIELPGYLSWKFCDDTKASFMEGDISSLENYKNKRLNVQHRNRMKNIKSFIEQRKEWLQECDQYFDLTNHGRIFIDAKTTKSIFAAMDSVSKELGALIGGVTYVSEGVDQDENQIIAGKFDNLFKLVDAHKTQSMLKSQFVTN
ncbi:MAG: hypothetical protein ACRBCS_01470 [Cellvibrionaceae bacterium]